VRRLAPALPLLLCLLGACAAPLGHPLRAETGPFVSLSANVAILDDFPAGCTVEGGCEGQARSQVTGTPLLISGGYAHVLWDHLGLMVGAYFPAWGVQQSNEWYAGLAAYGFVTVQNDRASLGFGPEVGFGGAAFTVGGEVRPWGGARQWLPALGAYGRWFLPYAPEEESLGGRSEATEAGLRLRVGPFYVQYALLTRARGFVAWNWSDWGRTLHLVALGVQADAEVFRSLR